MRREVSGLWTAGSTFTPRRRVVVRVFNRPDGSTATCCKFENGTQTFDGGGCESIRTPVNPDSLPKADNEDIARLTAAGR